MERIDRCIGLLVDNRAEIEEALNTDFGARSKESSAFTDVASSIGPLRALRPPYGAGIRKYLARAIGR